MCDKSDNRSVSKVISIRLKDAADSRLRRLARILRRTPGETARLLLEEKLKEDEFPLIEFRSSAAGRIAHVKGHRLAVWEVMLVAKPYGWDPTKTADHLQWPTEPVVEALAYAQAYPDEINPIVDEVEATGQSELRRRLPWLESAR